MYFRLLLKYRNDGRVVALTGEQSLQATTWEKGQRVQLNGKAKMKGDIVSERLICSEGASLVGHVTVGPDASKGPASPSGAPKDSPQKK